MFFFLFLLKSAYNLESVEYIFSFKGKLLNAFAFRFLLLFTCYVPFCDRLRLRSLFAGREAIQEAEVEAGTAEIGREAEVVLTTVIRVGGKLL